MENYTKRLNWREANEILSIVGRTRYDFSNHIGKNDSYLAQRHYRNGSDLVPLEIQSQLRQFVGEEHFLLALEEVRSKKTAKKASRKENTEERIEEKEQHNV